ncbi:MAG TPA: glycosyltransferase family 9 protein [Planctomycetota bacterium]
MSPGAPLARDARLLLRLPAWVGDLVMAEPLVRALAAHLEGGELTLAGAARHLALLEERFVRARRVDPADPAAWRGHDAALLCTGSFRSAWRAFRAGIPRRIGFARDGRAWLLTDAPVPARERGATPLGLGRAGGGRRYLPRPLERSLAELAGLVGVAVRDPRPRLEVREGWRARARARRAELGLAPEEPFLLASVGARPGSAKGLPPERWRAVLAPLARASGLPLLLLAAPGEEAAQAALAATCPGARSVRAPAADLPELAAHCAEARLVLCADSGARHVARAVGAAVACVAGPTDPRHAAGERGDEVLLRTTVPCGPCHRERCPLPAAEALRCWHELDVEQVLSAARAALAR